jgi:hypothetical protein
VTPEGLRDIDRRIAVAKGYEVYLRPGDGHMDWRKPGEQLWHCRASHTDPVVAMGLLREMVAAGLEPMFPRMGEGYVRHGYPYGINLNRTGSHTAGTLETAIALAWLAVFEGAE